MPNSKPFFRIVRGFVPSNNSGWSSWQYMRHPRYAASPRRYIQGYLMIQKDLEVILEYIQATDENARSYGYRIHELLMRTCVEIEANLKAILRANKYKRAPSDLNMKDYVRVEKSHHLSSYEVFLPIWDGLLSEFAPFESWRNDNPLPWYKAYNDSKHDRHDGLVKANLHTLVQAIGGLLVLLTAQFGGENFSAGSDHLSLGADLYKWKPATGTLFRIKYPNDWTQDELYNFNWKDLIVLDQPFEKFDYDAVL